MKNKLTKEDIQKRINIDELVFMASSSDNLDVIDKVVRKLEISLDLSKVEFYRKNTHNKNATLEDVKKSR